MTGVHPSSCTGSAALLAARCVRRAFRTGREPARVILAEIDLEIEPRTITWIRGPSGSGKSTLLHLLATLDRPDSGEIFVGGRAVGALGDDELARLRRESIGMVYQDGGLIARSSVWENVSLSLVPDGVRARERRERSAALLESLGLLDRLDALPHQLSGGEIQRVAVARALLHAPPVVIADEPVSQLDAEARAIILERFRSWRDQGGSVVLASHSDEVAPLADRSWLLREGRLQADP